MAIIRKDSHFWTSYSDLMTNLFFVMLMLFILAIALLHRKVVATTNELNKIEEIRRAIENIDTTYFEYNHEYKKHILKTQVRFHSGSSDIKDLPDSIREELIKVRETISAFLNDLYNKDHKASYLLVIEGQASKDTYNLNNQLSYNRALSLYEFWFPNSNKLSFGDFPCEIVIAGAGYWDGKPRSTLNEDNQRFLIQIMPKPGIIDH